jgi:hypothetical protein
VPSHRRMRGFDRDLIRGGHYGQRSCEPHLKAEHMAAPTSLRREESPCQSGAVHTWHIASFRCAAEVRRYRGIADIELDVPPPCNCNHGFSRTRFPEGSRSRGPGTLPRPPQHPATNCGGSAILRRSPPAPRRPGITSSAHTFSVRSKFQAC